VANDLLNIVNKVNNAIRSPEIRRIAMSTVLAKQKERIFQRGEDASSAKIGVYGTNPISIAKKNQARNTGKTFFKGGYSEYKTAIGKNPGYVNLVNTGQMQADLGLIVNGDTYAFGFQNEANANKSGWVEDKYSKEIFELSDPEFKLYVDVLQYELNRVI
jgi:hypothetical protein